MTDHMRIVADDVHELHDLADWLEAKGRRETAAWLRSLASRYEVVAGANNTARHYASAFFGWFNKHYPEPSSHDNHPWCRLGEWLGQTAPHAPIPSKPSIWLSDK
jgi:hypothetical protein